MLMVSTKTKPVWILLILTLSTGLNLYAHSLEQDSTSNKGQITTKEVIDKYFEAIGGKDLFLKIKDRIIYFSGSSMGQNTSVTIMQKIPNKLFQEIAVGEVHQKKYFDGKKGMLVLGDNKIEIDGSELERLKIDAAIDFLLNPREYDVKVEFVGVEMGDSIECCKIKMTLPSGKVWFQYFDAQTGLRIKETKEIETPTGTFNQETYYGSYRIVDGLKFPFKIEQKLGIQNTVLNVDSIKINSNLSDSLFIIPDL
jgi:zinc protease